ncbi:MAG: hypothetical protein KC535_02710 [Nanoarchaeota archaeon]|nr:hypothetical protein [Nanoarchaeota archaeon]
MERLDDYLQEAGNYIWSEFKLDLSKTKLKLYSEKNWRTFCEKNQFEKDAQGIYVPAGYSAYVRTDSPFLLSNIFHEYFGHGLFMEHSKMGLDLIDVIRQKGDEKSYLFGEKDPQVPSEGFFSKRIYDYEGFAYWLESHLDSQTGNKRLWDHKKILMDPLYRHVQEQFEEIYSQLPRLNFFGQLGFPKYYSSQDILDTVQYLYKDSFEHIEFIVLYGSQKPSSDIDLFICSDNESRNLVNGWLDIYELKKSDFEHKKKLLDLSVTDPLFSGTVIYDQNNLVEKSKREILSETITHSHIIHNARRSEEQKGFLDLCTSERDRKLTASYTRSFKLNAEQLGLGNKPLTLSNLRTYSGSHL